VEKIIVEELEAWREIGVEGHFRAKRAWFSYHEQFAEPMATIVGAKPSEVVLMGSLTANLHFVLASFYRPTPDRWRIIADEPAFPSDRYALESQVRWHGLSPADAIRWVRPREGEDALRLEDLEEAVRSCGDSLALVCMQGASYLTGQVHDMAAIASLARSVGAYVGFDLAHAAGNVPLSLHDWGVDFAVWCTYKYLNCGPGSVGGVFVHERNFEQPRLAGWWGNDPASRFRMLESFEPQAGAAGWQLSNAPVLSMAPAVVSLPLFVEAGMDRLAAKARALTDFLLALLDRERYPVVTPLDARGGQLSLRAPSAKALQEALAELGIICDFREPDILRLAVAPLYNTYLDVWRLASALEAL